MQMARLVLSVKEYQKPSASILADFMQLTGHELGAYQYCRNKSDSLLSSARFLSKAV